MGAIDKAFVRGPIEVRQARVVRTSLAKAASDHLPLVIDFHIGR
jgi:endonuclease/exonuclease/phosphatase family metal-dependent hydrolase